MLLIIEEVGWGKDLDVKSTKPKLLQFPCSSQGLTGKFVLHHRNYTLSHFLEKRTLETGIFTAYKCNCCCVFILTLSSLWDK